MNPDTPLPTFDPIAQSYFNYIQLHLMTSGFDPSLLIMRKGSVAKSCKYQKTLLAEIYKQNPSRSVMEYCGQVVSHFATIDPIDPTD